MAIRPFQKQFDVSTSINVNYAGLAFTQSRAILGPSELIHHYNLYLSLLATKFSSIA